MILQALVDYYDRMRAADPDALPEPGFEHKEIPFIIVLSKEGRFLNLEDTREGEGKKKRGRRFTVPIGARTSGIAPRLLWDDFRYVLGLSPLKASARDLRRTQQCHEAFVTRQKEALLLIPDDGGLQAVVSYLELGDFTGVRAHPLFHEIEADPRQLVSFKLAEADELVVERARVIVALRSLPAVEKPAQCLVTGVLAPIAITHPPIRGMKDRPGAPAEKRLVAFNTDVSPAFSSHGREQGANAPVSERAASAYTAALNRLLAPDSRLKAHIGESTAVFWAAEASPVEDLAAALFGDDPAALDDPERGVEKLRAVFAAPWQGHPPLSEDPTPFYVLGLAPNNARIAVRFWHHTTVAKFAGAVLQHFQDTDVARPDWLPRHPTIGALLRTTAVLSRDEKVPVNLQGLVVNAIITGAPYPRALLSATIRRIRAQPKAPSTSEDTRLWADRAAAIKACLVRTSRRPGLFHQEVQVSLDPRNDNTGYLLGRLFAALERAQAKAHPKVESGIRERYYASASATPVIAFPLLMKLKNHHLAKIPNRGEVVHLERLIGSIMDGVADFPAVLSTADQGRFALGYYHQRQAFFPKSDSSEEHYNA